MIDELALFRFAMHCVREMQETCFKDGLPVASLRLISSPESIHSLNHQGSHETVSNCNS